MKSITSLIIVIILIATAVFLGALIFQRFVNPSSNTFTQNSNPKLVPTVSIDSKARLSDLTTQERGNLLKRIRQSAVPKNSIQISASCKVDPTSIMVKKGTDVIVKNIDSNQHLFVFSGQVATLSSNQTFTVSTKDAKTGINRYGCDKQPSGYIVIEE